MFISSSYFYIIHFYENHLLNKWNVFNQFTKWSILLFSSYTLTTRKCKYLVLPGSLKLKKTYQIWFKIIKLWSFFFFCNQRNTWEHWSPNVPSRQNLIVISEYVKWLRNTSRAPTKENKIGSVGRGHFSAMFYADGFAYSVGFYPCHKTESTIWK